MLGGESESLEEGGGAEEADTAGCAGWECGGVGESVKSMIADTPTGVGNGRFAGSVWVGVIVFSSGIRLGVFLGESFSKVMILKEPMLKVTVSLLRILSAITALFVLIISSPRKRRVTLVRGPTRT